MNVVRLIVVGTVGAGKSTFVQTVNENELVSTECIVTDQTSQLKPTTTVALDFNRVTLSPDLTIHIYGTPGQYRFDFMWEILLQNAQLALVLVAAHRPEDFPSTCQILSFMHQRAQIPITVGLTHTDCHGALPPEQILAALGYTSGHNAPTVVTVNPHDHASVRQALAIAVETLPYPKKG